MSAPDHPTSRAELAARWRADAQVFRRYGSTGRARMLERLAAELEQTANDEAAAVVDLAGAAQLTGFTRGHLRRLFREGRLMPVRMEADEPLFTDAGLRVFPRISLPVGEEDRATPRGRISIGAAGVDEMMGGGIPRGDSVLVTGPSGSGKSVLATQFIADGVNQGDPGVLVVFEEHPKEYIHRAQGLGFPLRKMMKRGMLEVMYLRPLDLSPDETLFEIREAAERVKARRVVIDSMSGFEMALAPTFRTDFRESLYRLVGALTGVGITVLTTMEIVQDQTEMRFTPNVISFLADDLVLLRYCEVDGKMQKVLSVAKMRGSQHSKEFRTYEITGQGFEVGGILGGYRGSVSGAPFLTTGPG